MLRFVLACLSWFLVASSLHGEPPQLEGVEVEEHTVNVRWWKTNRFLEVRPSGYSTEDPGNTALVYLHGAFLSGERVLKERERRLIDLAKTEGFLILSPDSTGLWWSDHDDTFIQRMIEWAIEERGVDSTRVVGLGISSGGVMLYQMLLSYPGTFKAAYTLLSNIPKQFTRHRSNDYLPTPLAMIHGEKDLIHPSKGGFAVARFDMVASREDTIAFWVSMNQAESVPTVQQLPNTNTDDGSVIQLREYSSADGGSEVVSYLMSGVGHALPLLEKPDSLATKLGFPRNGDVDGFELGWMFLSSHLD